MLRSRLISVASTLLLALVLSSSVGGTVALAKRDHDEPPPGHARGDDKGKDNGRKQGHPHSDNESEEADEQDEGDDEQEASPSRSPSPSDHPGQGRGRGRGSDKSDLAATLEVGSRVDSFLAQVGETVHYTVTVMNTGSDPVPSVQVLDFVPAEIAVVRAPGATSVGANEIVWDVSELGPGQAVEFDWTGWVRRPGDLVAMNTVVASAGEVEPASFEDALYLAVASSPEVTNPTGDVVRRKIVRYVQPAATAPTTESAQGSVLPATGLDPSPWILIGLTLFGLGTVFAASRTVAVARVGAAAVICFALIGTACVGGDEPPADQEAGTEAPGDEDEGKDRVLGKRFDRGGVDDEDAEEEATEGEGTEADDDEGAGQEDEPEDAAPPPGPPEPAEPERVVEIVTVQAEDLPIVDQGSRPGDNVVNYEWDDTAGEITQATSGRRFSADQPVELLSSLGSGGGALVTEVTLTNLDRDHRLRVEGRFVLEITDGSTSTTLTSEAVSVVLNPDGSASAEFEYRLPSGAYANSVSFRAE